MIRVRLKVAAPLPRERLILATLVATGVVCLALGLPRIALVPPFGVTWNVVPGAVALLVAGLLYGAAPRVEAPRDPMVGYPVLLVLLPMLTAVAAFGRTPLRFLVGRDVLLVHALSAGGGEGASTLLRAVAGIVGHKVAPLALTSLLLHGVCAALVGVLALRMARDRGVGLIAGVLFAAFPLAAEPVSYLSRSGLLEGNLLCLASALLGGLAFAVVEPRTRVLRRKGRQSRADLEAERHERQRAERDRLVRLGFLAGSLLLLFLAAARSPLAYGVPLVLAVLDIREREVVMGRLDVRTAALATLVRTAPHVAVLVLSAIVWGAPWSAEELSLSLCAKLVTFPRDLLIPLSSAHFKTQPLVIFVGVLLMLLLLGSALLRGRPSISSTVGGLAVSTAWALPALPFVATHEGPDGASYLYLAAAGYVIAGAVYLRLAVATDRSGGALLVAFALLVSVVTLRQNIRLWRQTARLSGDVVRALSTVGQTTPVDGTVALRQWPAAVDGIPFPTASEIGLLVARDLSPSKVPVHFIAQEDLAPGAHPDRTIRFNVDARWIEEVGPGE